MSLSPLSLLCSDSGQAPPPPTALPARCGRALALLFAAAIASCGGGGESPPADGPVTGSPAPAPSPSPAPPPAPGPSPGATPSPPPSPASIDGPAAGHAGGCAVPSAGQAASLSSVTSIVGDGTPASCTSAAVVAAVARGGVVTFNCGADPVTITMTQTAKVFNDRPDLVLDGGGKVTLSGGNAVRILYQNTCDSRQVWTSARCDTQQTPKLTVQNLTLVDGNSAGQSYDLPNDVYGGGAIYVRGGHLKIVNSRFFRNRCESTGPDLGGAAVRAFGTQGPVYVVNSTFGGAAGYGNECSNGGALSGLGASFSVYNSLFTHNKAVGRGANPAQAGTPGGGSGGAIYQDGNAFDLTLCGNAIRHNTANEGGGALFFVSNNRSGTLSLTDSVLQSNSSGKFETNGYPGIFVLAAPGQPVVTRSTLTP